MRIPSIIMLYEKTKKVNELQGSSLVSPALGVEGQGRLNIKDNFPPKKNRAKPKRAGKKKKGCGENEFFPARFPPKAE